MYIRRASELSNLDLSDIQTLLEFNIRHVEQLVGLLRSRTGRESLKLLPLRINFTDLEKRTNKWFRSSSKTKQIGFAAGLTSDQLDEADSFKPSYSLGCTILINDRPLLSRDLDFGDVIPPDIMQGGTNGERSSSTLPEENGSTEVGEEVATEAAYPLPHEHAIIYNLGQMSRFPMARDQGYRGTCAAFTGCHLFEEYLKVRVEPESPKLYHSIAGKLPFSPQYLFYRAKQIDDDSRSDGTTLSCIMRALTDYGVCPDRDAEYHSHHDWGHAELFNQPRFQYEQIESTGRLNTVAGYQHLKNAADVQDIKRELLKGRAVGLAVPVFRNAWMNPYSRRRGEIQIPLFRQEADGGVKILDIFDGGHAITLYGYVDNRDEENGRPGGGYFIFRNSWGTEWASSDIDSPRGYGLIPYRYIQLFGLDAVIITKIRVFSDGKTYEF